MYLRKTTYSYYGTPALGIVGAVLVLMVVLVVVTVSDIRRQKADSIRLLIEKGSALIRSVEAGSRTGIAFSRWGRQHLERLLAETASQNDIAYLSVLDASGNVLADSGHAADETISLQGIDLAAVAASTTLLSRQVTATDGRRLFEVYRRFVPMPPPRGMHMMGLEMRMGERGMMRHRFPEGGATPGEEDFPDLVIFAGLDMTTIEAARSANVRRSMLMAAVLMLVGGAGFYLVYVLQNYRAARTSMSRLKSFSASLADNLPMGLVTTDRAHCVASLNPAAEAILGLARGDAVGRPAAEALPPELSDVLARVSTEGGMELELECCLGSHDARPLAVSASSWQDDEGGFLGNILLVKDLTEVTALRKEIAKNQRLASLGSLAAGVAHEIRNPLSSIKGFATYFKERYRDMDADRETADIMIGEVDRLNRVVGQLLELSRPIDISPTPADIRALLDRSVSAVQPQIARKKVIVAVSVNDDLPPVTVDEDRIHQVLINLYLNAIEAMPEEGGRLTISARKHHGRPPRLRISIVDNGAGIPAGQVGHVFDPYFTTKPTGTGLGLAIVLNIVEAHHGRITVDSGQGTTRFTLTLPLAQGDAS